MKQCVRCNKVWAHDGPCEPISLEPPRAPIGEPEYFDQPLVVVECVVRFRANPIVRHLLNNGGIDMNALARLDFPDWARRQFAQLIGYSVSGYGDLSYVGDAAYERAQRAAETISQPHTTPEREVRAPIGEPGLLKELTDLVSFLDGSAPMEGVWYGEKHPNERGAYWWRRRLNVLHARLYNALTDSAGSDTLETRELVGGDV